MNPDIKRKWISALRSGEYTQGRHALKYEENGQLKWCCLGVLCDISGLSTWERAAGQPEMFMYARGKLDLPTTVREWAGLKESNPNLPSMPAIEDGQGGSTPCSLAYLNDRGLTFHEIADLIEAQL